MPVPRPFPNVRPRLAALLAVLPPLMVPLEVGAQPDCGTPGTMTVKTADGSGTTKTATRVFADGSVAVRARLAVNPDGGQASYTVGDAGFTYIANGLDRWSGGKTISCQAGGCRPDFLKAEQMGFGPGSPAFCVYAIEVDPFTEGGSRTAHARTHPADGGLPAEVGDEVAPGQRSARLAVENGQCLFLGRRVQEASHGRAHQRGGAAARATTSFCSAPRVRSKRARAVKAVPG